MPPTDAASEAPLLRMRGIRKSFPGVKALKGVDLSLHAGEVLALLGIMIPILLMAQFRSQLFNNDAF